MLVLFNGVNAEEILWESGKNLHIKIDDQDKASDGPAKPNEHPVRLDPKQITNALKYLKVFDKENKFKPVFAIQQATLLGKYLANGLSQADPDQDILFALVKTDTAYVVVKEVYYMAGRAFYVDGKLNIIIGDYDRLPNKFQERAEASHGSTGGIFYFFKHGQRAKPSKFKKRLVTKEGVSTYVDGPKRRQDWLVIDVAKASALYFAEKERNRKPTTNELVDEAMRQEAEKLAQDRREMRLEMARMRKEINDSKANKEQLSIEERLAKLDELHKSKLITDVEYDQKRKEILDDI